MRKITSYEIALSALSCALATVFLTVGVYTDVLLLTAYLLASIALMLPLSKRSWWGYVLAYLATCILTTIFTSWKFWDVLPFIAFFGLHPLANELQIKHKINKWLAFGIKAVWFDGAAYLIWRFIFEMTTNIHFLDKYMLWIILVAGTAFFLLYDYVAFKWRGIINRLVQRISKK